MSATSIEWRPIPDVPGYEVSNDGRIRNARTLKELTLQSHPSGHRHIQLRLGGKEGQLLKVWVHRAVLTAFVRYPWPNEEGCHRNGDPTNNSVGNLYWGTRLENVADKQRHGTQPRGEKAGTAKLTESQVLEIRQRVGTKPLRVLAAEYGVSHTAIRRAANGMKWGHLNV